MPPPLIFMLMYRIGRRRGALLKAVRGVELKGRIETAEGKLEEGGHRYECLLLIYPL